MYIKSIQIKNYMSFYESDEIILSNGFNVIVGPNNAGKTSLLQALSRNLGNKPHLSLLTLRENGAKLQNQESEFVYRINLSKVEFTQFRVPNTALRIRMPYNNKQMAQDFVEKLNNDRLPSLIVRYQPPNTALAHFEFSASFMEPPESATINFDADTNLWKLINIGRHSPVFEETLEKKLLIYMFDAQRIPPSQEKITTGSDLSPNASNLPSVLHNLTSNNARFRRFNRLVNYVFPEVKQVSTRLISGSSVEIRIWNIDPQTEREDLTVSLRECGAGIGQVLAILYVLVTAETRRTILIDEPQTYLHPGAIRKLFDILKQHSVKHQYIFTTHSSLVTSAADPDNILLVTKEGAESRVEQIDRSQKREMYSVLQSVGASLSDVFGADNVLWVEGPTEEKCFPLIIRKFFGDRLQGTVIHSVVATGDLVEKKNKNLELILKIYNRLTKSVALMPFTIGFIFDRESLSKDTIIELEQRSQDDFGIARMTFLPATMYENYVLHAGAIASVLSNDLERVVKEADVQSWLNDNIPEDEDFHATNKLHELFLALSENKCDYKNYKVEYGYELTRWILENDPEFLRPLADFLDDCFEKWANPPT